MSFERLALRVEVARRAGAYDSIIARAQKAREAHHAAYHRAHGAAGLLIVIEQATPSSRRATAELEAARNYLERLRVRVERLGKIADRLARRRAKASDALRAARLAL